MTRSPLWARVLLRCLAPRDDVDTVLGDLEERRYTVFETLDMAVALVRGRPAKRSDGLRTISRRGASTRARSSSSARALKEA